MHFVACFETALLGAEAEADAIDQGIFENCRLVGKATTSTIQTGVQPEGVDLVDVD